MHHSNETFLAKCLQSTIIYLIGQIGFTVTDIGEGPGPGPSIFLDQTEARRAKKKFFWRLPNPLPAPPPSPPSKGLDDWSQSGIVQDATFRVQHYCNPH